MSPLTLLCYLLALALMALGVAGWLFPDPVSRLYGVRALDDSTHGYVRAFSARDFAIGAALAVATYAQVLVLLVTLIAVGLAISLADFAIVYRARGKRLHASHAGHGAGAIAFVVALAMALFAIGR